MTWRPQQVEVYITPPTSIARTPVSSTTKSRLSHAWRIFSTPFFSSKSIGVNRIRDNIRKQQVSELLVLPKSWDYRGVEETPKGQKWWANWGIVRFLHTLSPPEHPPLTFRLVNSIPLKISFWLQISLIESFSWNSRLDSIVMYAFVADATMMQSTCISKISYSH